MRSSKMYGICVILTLLIAGLAIHGLVSGSKLVTLSDLWSWCNGEAISPLQQKILLDIRLPVVLTAIGVGAALGAAGAVFQSVSRNPLGSPDVLGFTSGAAAGAVYHLIFLGQAPSGVALFAFVGGCITALLIYLCAIKGQGLNTNRLVLVGIGVGATLTAATGFLLVTGDIDNAMLANLWLAGSLDGRHWGHVLTLAPAVLFGLPALAFMAKALNLTEMGDALATGIGVNIPLSRNLSLLIAVLLVALATAAAGPIAFIALGAPHLARIWARHSLPLVTSALMGAALLLAADRIGAIMPVAENLPVGRITAVIGGIYLILLLLNQNKRRAL